MEDWLKLLLYTLFIYTTIPFILLTATITLISIGIKNMKHKQNIKKYNKGLILLSIGLGMVLLLFGYLLILFNPKLSNKNKKYYGIYN